MTFYNKSAASKSVNVPRDPFLEHFGLFFIADLFLDRRLTITNTVDSFDYEEKPPANELQALYINTDAKNALLKEAVQVFGKAIWLDITRANKLCLRVAEDETLPSSDDRLEPEKMRKYRLIEDEGDGLKSYIGTCLTLILGQHPICLIDEPELCLHPPQAYALGRFIGKYGISTDRATFVATHSSHILRGIIEQTKQLEIIRLSRTNSRFSGKKVSHDKIQACIQKPSTKIETILDGLFAEAVTIVESEGDRLVYSTTWERLARDFHHDVHFVSVGGIGGIADTCQLYRNLKIPVCVIADLDLLRDSQIFERVVQSLTSAEQTREVISTCRKIVAKIKALGPTCSATETREELQKIINEMLDWSNTENIAQTNRTLSKLSAGMSDTVRLKHGVDSFASQDFFHDMKAFINKCRSFGLFLVPCGELENWLPNLMVNGPSKRKKSEWANMAANKIREATDTESDIWDFIRQMARYQKDEVSRMSGYSN